MEVIGSKVGPLPCAATELEVTCFGQVAQPETARTVQGSGAVKALPDYAPGVSLQSLTSPHPPRPRQHFHHAAYKLPPARPRQVRL